MSLLESCFKWESKFLSFNLAVILIEMSSFARGNLGIMYSVIQNYFKKSCMFSV